MSRRSVWGHKLSAKLAIPNVSKKLLQILTEKKNDKDERPPAVEVVMSSGNDPRRGYKYVAIFYAHWIL